MMELYSWLPWNCAANYPHNRYGAKAMWYEVRRHVDDIPVIFNSERGAEAYARRLAERSGFPALLYECSEDGEQFIGVAD